MSTFDDREKAYESKFAHDEEKKFRVNARRMKLLGLWAADLLGRTGDDAAAYALAVVKADFAGPGHQDAVQMIVADLAGRVTADAVRARMAELLPVAEAQLMNEAG